MKPVKDNEDSAVSEIIGALLLFAIGTTVLTGFILWYVPSTGTTNDQGYQSATQSAFTTLDSKMLAPSLAPGSATSQSFPLGINGAPPFSSPTDSSLCYSSSFSASMKEKYNLSYYNRVPVKNQTVIAAANASISNSYNNVYANNQFTYSVNFIESGLNASNYWTVTIQGKSLSSSSSLISFSLPEGTYGYSISGSSNQLLSSKGGSIIVNNSNVNVPIEFYTSSSLSGIIAEVNGTKGDLSPINSQNQISDFYQSGITYSNSGDGVVNYWLNGTQNLNNTNTSTSNAMALGSQAFHVYSTTPMNYYEYYLMQSDDYINSVQCIIGPYNVYSFISTSPLNPATSITPINIFHHNKNQVNQYVYVNLSSLPSVQNKPITLKPGTYYLNFYEQVNGRNANNNIIYQYPNTNYIHIVLTGNGCTNFYTNLNQMWGYGPTELIGTMSNPEFSVGVGNSYSFSANYWESGTYPESTNYNTPYGPGGSSYDNFSITADSPVIGSSNPYVFVVGYHLSSQTLYPVHFNETGLSVGDQWNVSVNGISNSSTVTASGKNMTFKLPIGTYQFGVNSSNTELSNPSTGIINVSGTKYNVINVSFATPRGSNPLYYGINSMACQNFTVSKSNTYLNYISLYLYNFTVPAASYTHGSPTNRITITISNSTSHNFIEVGYTVNNTGWNQIFLSKSGHYNLGKGNYTLKVNGTGYSRNIIGWGFSTTGGYDNYLKEDASNALDQSLNIAKYSSITAYSNGLLTEASNQVFLFSLGYFNISESNLLLTKNITFNHSANGEILSNGFTQFTYQAIYAIQDGASLEASAGVTFATVNPLPIQLIGTKNNLAFSSYIYSMNIIKGIPTSISGDGSTILSISLANRTSLNYTVGNSYFFGGATQSIYGKVVNINLTAFSYSITSNFAKYWMDSFYTQLPVNTADKSNSHYNITVGGYNYFNVVLNNDQLYFSLNQSLMSLSQFSKGIPIYSISNLYQSYLVTQV